MSTAEHYFLSASSAFRWRYCAGSAALAPLFPEPDTDDSREGTASHWYGAEVLQGRTPEASAPNGVLLSEEMKQGAMVWVDDVRNLVKRYEGRSTATVMIEQKGQARDIHPEHCGGTPDTVIILPGVKRIVVLDYKYGHAEVDPIENEQLLVYTSQVIDDMGLDGKDEQQWTVEFRIIQPRCFTADGPVRWWASNVAALRPHWNDLRRAATQALLPNAPTVSGPWCRNCPARGPCATAKRATMNAVDVSKDAAIEPLTPDSVSFELGLLYEAADRIKSRITAMEQQGEQFIRQGKPVPGFAMKAQQTRLAWRADLSKSDIVAMGAAYGVVLDKGDFITPTQAIAKGIDDTVINAYAHRPNGGMKFTKEDSSRIIRILQAHPTTK